MADRWIITIEAWPHSTGKGDNADQEAAGPRKNDFAVRALDMKAAFEAAEHIAMGMRVNPMIWRAPITAILKSGDQP
jgi:hypothetical protein